MTALALALAYLGTLAFAAFVLHRRGSEAKLTERVRQAEADIHLLNERAFSSMASAPALADRVQQLEESVEPLILSAGLRRK